MSFLNKSFNLVPNLGKRYGTSDIEAGDLITILPYEQIMQTLDENDCCDGLLFMENMKQYCNKEYKVLKRVKWVFDEDKKKMLSCRDIVVLHDLFCDGNGMVSGKDCDRSCTLLWKTDWFTRSGDRHARAAQGPETKLNQKTHEEAKKEGNETACICQYTWLDRMGREFNRIETVWHILLRLWPALKRRALKYAGICMNILINSNHRKSKGSRINAATNIHNDLRCGDVVRILPYGQIKQTLDKNGKYKGLTFLKGMKEHCGKTCIVLKEPRYLLDPEGKKVYSCKNLVICGQLYCDGTNIRCDRSCLYYWKKDWITVHDNKTAHRDTYLS